MSDSKNDIKENRLADIDKSLIDILLKDNTTKKNLLWATDSYSKKGPAYFFDKHINPDLITGYRGSVIKPRIAKSKSDRQARSRDKAEVFTPSWVCNAQNNLIDNEWFKSENSFNFEIENGWETNYRKIKFPRNSKRNWKEYIKSIRLEITCGEAPYITSRYDTVTGDYIEVKNRIGFLDRKLRVVSENIDDEKQWVEWATRAVKASYGYDWQGDNVLLARENVIYTVIEHYDDKFNSTIETDTIIKIAKIVSWNIWQMDGLKFVIPYSCKPIISTQTSLFGEEEIQQPCEGCDKNNPHKHNGSYCLIMDWQAHKKIKFIDLMER